VEEGGGGRVFLEEMPCSTIYSKKDYKKKQKEHHSYKIRTQYLRMLNQEDKLNNLKKQMQKNVVSVQGVSEV
jgi:hypothetical protein